jgi:pimeloyl-ACP methyl ester carboxylesterase
MRVGVGDTTLFFDVDGPSLVPAESSMRERPTILLVHTGPGYDHAVFKDQIGPALTEVGQVVYLDLRGHGRSDPAPPQQLTLDRWADDLHGFCLELGLSRPVVLGHGFGSMVVMRYAARHPDHPARLVLVNPAARILVSRIVAAYDRIGGPEAGEAAMHFYEQPDERSFARFLRVCLPLFSARGLDAELTTRANWNPEVAMVWLRGEMRSLDLRPELGRIRVPALVLAGEDDPQHTVIGAEEVVAGLPSVAGFHRYANARHAVFRDAPEALDDLRQFLVGSNGTPVEAARLSRR